MGIGRPYQHHGLPFYSLVMAQNGAGQLNCSVCERPLYQTEPTVPISSENQPLSAVGHWKATSRLYQ